FARNVSVATGAGGVFTLNGGGGNAGVGDGGVGTITIAADDMVISDQITAGATGTVTLKPVSAARAIDLGTNTAGKLGLTDTETDFVTAGTLIIGDVTNTGGITLSAGGISRTGSGWTNLELRTKGLLSLAQAIVTNGKDLTILADK